MSRGKPVHALLGLALTALAAEAVSAEVTVHFIEPSRYTDVGAVDAERERALSVLERHLRAATDVSPAALIPPSHTRLRGGRCTIYGFAQRRSRL
jgi:hypothetical protein